MEIQEWEELLLRSIRIKISLDKELMLAELMTLKVTKIKQLSNNSIKKSLRSKWKSKRG
jgi:hypothetical protein